MENLLEYYIRLRGIFLECGFNWHWLNHSDDVIENIPPAIIEERIGYMEELMDNSNGNTLTYIYYTYSREYGTPVRILGSKNINYKSIKREICLEKILQ